MFKLFKKRDAAGRQTAGEERYRALLYISDHSWRAAIIDQHNERETRVIGDEGEALKALGDLPKDAHTGQIIEQMFKLANEALRKQEPAKIGDVRIVIADPRVLYSDTLPGMYSSASTATLHEFGRANLHCRSVSYGLGKFGPVDRGAARASAGVIAFVDAVRLGGYLSRLDRLALKVTAVTPLADILVRHGQAGHRSGAGASLYIGAMVSIMVVYNPTAGAVVTRALPFGVAMLARLIADGNGVSLEEAMRSLADQDLVSELRGEESGDGLATITRSPAERILGEVARNFLNNIKSTISFFEEQRCAGRPVQLDIFGDFDRVRGMRRFLQENLGSGPSPLTLDFFEGSILDVVLAMPSDGTLNLLSEAGGDLKIGAATYIFQNQRLRPSEEVRREAVAREQTRSDRRPSASERSSRRGAPAPKPSFLSQLTSKLSGGASVSTTTQDGDGSKRQETQAFALLALVVVGVGYLINNMASDATTKAARQVSTLSAAIRENARVSSELAKGGTQFTSVQDVDKVLWTEKILALSNHMTNEIWLTDLYLKSESKMLDKTSINMKKLVMEGAVLPSTDGHIQKVAEYIEALLNDKELFMSDFKDISFQGISLDSSESDQIVRFAIEALYDEAKGLENRHSSASSGGASDKNSIDMMKQSVDEHNRQLNQVMPNK